MPVGPGARERGGLETLLFSAAAFASAFLIFLVQPMVGKRILPWFGGVPAVWTLCLAFYQTALFAGYAYAHWLVRSTRPGLQIAAHALVVGAALLTLPVLPPETWRPVGGGDPSAAILAMLGAHVAAPFVALAATGPLVQAWFARRHPSRSPYPLYAVSNAGSFLALFAYPFLVEPHLPLSLTGRLWSWGFAITGAGVLACAALARRDAWGGRSPGAAWPVPGRVALWLLLPGCAVVLLMGVTGALTLDVAGVPFLWVLPLGVYLASFVLCFGSERTYRRVPWLLAAVVALLAQWWIPAAGYAGDSRVLAVGSSLQVQIALHAVALFAACMVLHGELYRLRPPASGLTGFYLCISGGGALGGIFVGALAPRLFDDYHELPLGFALGWLLLLATCWQDSGGWLSRSSPRWRWAAVVALTAALLPVAASRRLERPERLVHQERSFFGVLRVAHLSGAGGDQRQLAHGSTLHGVQFRAAPRRPTSYFGVQTGIGLALAQREPAVPSAVGVIGLGIGTLAAYGRPGDRFRFYEIDPAVVRIARDERFFSYLARSGAQIETVEGDARISLSAELASDDPPRFDFLIVDAFSSDAIPMHLLTREALAVYLDALDPRGLLAFHVSNHHFDLVPVVARLADDAGLGALAIETDSIPGQLSAEASWVFVARDERRLDSLAGLAIARRKELGLLPNAMVVRRPPPEVVATTPLWTDDYSDLLGAMRPLRLRPGSGGGRSAAAATGFDGGALRR